MSKIDERAFDEVCKKYNIAPKNGTANSDINPITRKFWYELISSYESAKLSEQPVARPQPNKNGQVGCFYCSFTGKVSEECCPVCGGTGDAKPKGHLCWKCQGAGVINSPKRESVAPTEAMCDRARWFILARDSNIFTWGGLTRCTDKTIPYIAEKMTNDPQGHITKWDFAECIYRLMTTHIEDEITKQGVE